MPKTRKHRAAAAFGERLVELLERSGRTRRGAGSYLARRYNVAAVTANAWLNGTHMCETETAKRIAQDHGSTFEALYFGLPKGSSAASAPRNPGSSIDVLLPAATPRSKARLTLYREKLERGDALTDHERRDLASIIKRLEALNAAIQ